MRSFCTAKDISVFTPFNEPIKLMMLSTTGLRAQLFETSLAYYYYCKNSKNWDTLNYYRDCPTNGIVRFYSAIFRLKDADRITNRVDTDQTAP